MVLSVVSSMSLALRVKTDRATPFLKWAGGKGRLLEQYANLFPIKFKTYYEPFVGGGAVFFHLVDRHPGMNSWLSDGNAELVNCYLTVRDQPDDLLALLETMRNDEKYFYKQRAKDVAKLDELERAARFIYLNKTCFNGLYRENQSGQFNVPFGRYKNPRIADGVNVHAASDALSNAHIHAGPFELMAARAKSGDFVYFDPPYMPVSKTANFVSYTSSNFSYDDQARLAKLARKLKSKGVLVMVSNSDVPEIRELYHDFNLKVVKAPRAINCRGDRRGPVDELVIRSY